MARALVSGSSLGRVLVCPPSASLPRVDHVGVNTLGQAMHDHLRQRVDWGIDGAMMAIEATAARWHLDERETGIFRARCRGFEWVPKPGAAAEIPLALFTDGSVRRVAGGAGDYELPEGAIFPATIDLIWAEPEPLIWAAPDPETGIQPPPVCPPQSTLWVADYKTGAEIYVAAAEQNPQVQACAMLAAKWTGARRVLPAILYVRKGPGLWDTPPHWYEAKHVAAFEAMVRAAVAAAAAARAALERGEAPTYVEGEQCTYCPGESRCPAKTAQLRALLGDETVPFGDAPLAPAQAHRLAVIEPQIRALQRRARAALEAYVRANGPIPLGEDKRWGPYEHRETAALERVAVEVLTEEIGPEAAAAARPIATMPKAAIEDAVRRAHEEAGIKRKLAPTVRRVFAKIGERGGLIDRAETWWGAHKPPPPPAPSLEEKLRASLEGLEIDGDLP